VVHVAPPFRALHDLLWDFPRMRFTFIFAWRKAVRDIIERVDGDWKHVSGPVSAAMCHLKHIGVQWVAPFCIDIDGTRIQLLEVPPVHVYAVLRDHARVQLDIAFTRRIAQQRGWNSDAVLGRYANGVDWEFIRVLLRSPSVSLARKRALQVVAAGAFWSDERRWLAGYQPTPECSLCRDAVGDDAHFFRRGVRGSSTGYPLGANSGKAARHACRVRGPSLGSADGALPPPTPPQMETCPRDRA
jgi:hypothetical protein